MAAGILVRFGELVKSARHGFLPGNYGPARIQFHYEGPGVRPEDCLAALREKTPDAAIKEIVARALAEPRHVLTVLGEPKLAGIETIYRSKDLTILEERAFDLEHAKRVFEESNQRLRTAKLV
jgi:hypothetical protein